jgi:hypothetical protein
MCNRLRRLLLTVFASCALAFPQVIRAFALATAVALLFPGAAWAQKGGGSHGGGSHASGGAKGGTSTKTVHVKGYTKADGTRVEGYDRREPVSEPSLGEVARAAAAARSARTPAAPITPSSSRENAQTTASAPSRATSATHAATGRPPNYTATTPGGSRVVAGSIRAFTDPATGRTTYTDVARSPVPATASTPTKPTTAPIHPVSDTTTASGTRLRTAQGYLARSAAAMGSKTGCAAAGLTAGRLPGRPHGSGSASSEGGPMRLSAPRVG